MKLNKLMAFVGTGVAAIAMSGMAGTQPAAASTFTMNAFHAQVRPLFNIDNDRQGDRDDQNRSRHNDNRRKDEQRRRDEERRREEEQRRNQQTQIQWYPNFENSNRNKDDNSRWNSNHNGWNRSDQNPWNQTHQNGGNQDDRRGQQNNRNDRDHDGN